MENIHDFLQHTKLSKCHKTLVTPHEPISNYYLNISTSTHLLSFSNIFVFKLDSEVCNFLHKAERSQFKTWVISSPWSALADQTLESHLSWNNPVFAFICKFIKTWLWIKQNNLRYVGAKQLVDARVITVFRNTYKVLWIFSDILQGLDNEICIRKCPCFTALKIIKTNTFRTFSPRLKLTLVCPDQTWICFFGR